MIHEMPPLPPRFGHRRSLIPGYPKSVALLSIANQQDVTGAVVFVHGYSGAARNTWTDFISLIDDPQTSEWWITRDVYFYNYTWNSVFRDISSNADALLVFLRTVFPQPPGSYLRSRTGRGNQFAFAIHPTMTSSQLSDIP